MQTQLKSVDARSIVRLACSISVAKGGQSAPIGTINDISLDGAFITTQEPLAPGSAIPLVFALGDKGPVIRPDVEVIRVTAEGMGVRYTSLSKQDVRRLRRYITDLANIVNNQQAARNFATAGEHGPKPISGRDKIRALLTSAVGHTTITIIPQARPQRERFALVSVRDDQLDFLLTAPTTLKLSEPVFALYTYEYASYSFETQVIAVTANTLSLALPDVLRYSERRISERERKEGGTVSFELPWRAGASITCPLLERTAHGLSFAATQGETYFWPNVKLPSVSIQTLTTQETIHGAVVRHVTAVEEYDGKAYIRVGVAFPGAKDAATTQEKLGSEFNSSNAATRWGRDIAAKATYLLHKTLNRVRPQDNDSLPLAVQFPNTRKQPVAGLLNVTNKTGKRSRMPVVIVTPGFGARKETMSALGYIITENFRRNHKDIAVLRFDGTNSIGESYKDPGCEGDGKENLHYTVSAGVSDLVGAVNWVKSNRLVEATDIAIVSVSFSSIAVRHALTLDALADVRHWIAFMGAPDAQNAIMNIAGNVDPYAYFLAGQQVGIVSLLGCLVDAHQCCADMQKLGVATLEDARREMALIKANLTWFIGKHDAFMDAARVRNIMSVAAPGQRQIVEVNAGHVPQSSDEAMHEFAAIARHLWRGLNKSDIEPFIPSPGRVALVHEHEWQRVRKGGLESQQDYWKGYLLGDSTGLGYDVWSLTPEYEQLLTDTVAVADVAGKQVLDLGTGTGNLTIKLLERGPAKMTSLDLVPEAIERLKSKLSDPSSVQCVTASADGNARVAMRRWLCGDIYGIAGLVVSLPPPLQPAFADIVLNYNPDVHAYLRGADLDVTELARGAKLSMAAARDLQALRTMLGCVAGATDLETTRKILPAAFHPVLDTSDGLPFPDASFDLVFSSLVLSYMERVEDTLFEIRRILRPGGLFVASTLAPDADSSKMFMNAIHHYESVSENQLPQGHSRETILQALREFVDRGAGLLRLEEEGVFHFWSADDFARLFKKSGFRDVAMHPSFGLPPQALIAVGRKD